MTWRESPQAGCTGLPDIERLNRKLEKRKIGLADLCQLYRASSRLPMIEEAIREHEGSHSELLCTRYPSPAVICIDLARGSELPLQQPSCDPYRAQLDWAVPHTALHQSHLLSDNEQPLCALSTARI